MEEYDYEKEMDKDVRLVLIGVLVLALVWSIEATIVEVVKSIYGPKNEVKVEAKK